jgi:hypothetical protein
VCEVVHKFVRNNIILLFYLSLTNWRNIMGRELNAVEMNVEILDNATDQSPTELSDLSLALIGGGAGSVVF